MPVSPAVDSAAGMPVSMASWPQELSLLCCSPDYLHALNRQTKKKNCTKNLTDLTQDIKSTWIKTRRFTTCKSSQPTEPTIHVLLEYVGPQALTQALSNLYLWHQHQQATRCTYYWAFFQHSDMLLLLTEHLLETHKKKRHFQQTKLNLHSSHSSSDNSLLVTF